MYPDRVGDILTGESLELFNSMMRSVFHEFLDELNTFVVGQAAFRGAFERITIEILKT